ncbi:MAG: RNA polymerase sporulation sigma factor SigE [Clostridia bacterium]|nr:RNA polymerase sporulation sigma factor SigE [Clostridia bacterium]
MKIIIIAQNFIKATLQKLKGMTKSHYINGPDILPPPFTAAEEEQLLSQMDQNPEQVKSELVTHNLRLVVYIAKKFETHTAGIEDLISIGTIGLIKAVGTFKPEKGIKLATYASRCIENEILMYLRKTSNLKAEISLDEPLNVDWDGNELLLSDILGSDGDEISRGIEMQDEHNILKQLVASLPPRERQIMEMRFGMFGYEEYTQKQIADCLGISQSYISRLEKRIIDKLKKSIEKAVG